MNEKLSVFLEKCNEILGNCEKYIFLARSKEFQQESLEVIEKLVQEAIIISEEMIKKGDGDSANASLSIMANIISIKCKFLMLIALKNDDPNKAWDYLIDAQRYGIIAMRAHKIGDILGPYVETLYLIEKIIFPPQQFTSVGIIVSRFRCSICGIEYGECEHLERKAYMGKICKKIVEDPDHITEITLVEEPASKKCRVNSFFDGKVNRDFMTWQIIPKDDSEKKGEFTCRASIIEGGSFLE